MLRSGKRRSLLCTVVAALVMAPAVMPASASMWSAMQDFKKPNMRWGLLEVRPYAKLSETYDSNIYLVPKLPISKPQVGGGVVGSWITRPLGGLNLALPLTSMHQVTAHYDAQGNLYSKQSTANNSANQSGDVGYHYRGPQGWTANVGDSYLNTVDPAFSELIQREQRWQNTAGGDIQYAPEGGRLFGGADVQLTKHKYVGPSVGAFLDRIEDLFGFKGGYQLAPKTRAYAAYHRGLTHFDAGRTAHHKDHYVDLGIEGVIAPKVTGQVQAGLDNRHYDAPPVAGQKRNLNLFDVATKLTWKPLDRSAVNLAVSRALQESVFGANQYYEDSNVSIGIRHELPYKLTAGVNVSTGWDKYPVPTTPAAGAPLLNRRDDINQQAVTLDYAIQQYLSVGIGYLHRSRWAKNFTDQFNYEDHQTNINIALAF